MLGRNIDEERGKPSRASPAGSMSEQETELMGQATRCVRKFAPQGRKKMRRTDNGHITACKISDANPNEMIASWSGDHIYSFDLVRSPDAREAERQDANRSMKASNEGKSRESSDRKRKRKKQNSMTSNEGRRRSPKPRRAKESLGGEDDLALRVRYDNGQSEDIAMSNNVLGLRPTMLEEARDVILNESQKRSLQIGKSLVRIRKLLFSLEASAHNSEELSSSEPANHVPSFTAALGVAASCLPEMDDISRSWRYPMDPLEEELVLQQTLRSNRDASRRFIQAAGTLTRMLGGRIQTASQTPSPALDLFQEVVPGPNEGSNPTDREIFCYDLLKAILLWLEGGTQALLQGFKNSPNRRGHGSRYPLPDDAQPSSINDILIPYLLHLAGTRPIPNIDASRFERDVTRQIFKTETAAVIAFAHAIRVPLEDLTRAVVPTPGVQEDGLRPLMQDRKTALKFWAFKVGRGILMNAGEGVDYQFVDIAFGGLGTSQIEEDKPQQDIDPNEEEDVVKKVNLVKRSREAHTVPKTRDCTGDDRDESVAASRAPSVSLHGTGSDIDIEDAGSDADVILMDDLHDEIAEHMAAEDENEENDDNEEDGNDHSDLNDEDDDGDGDITAEERQFMFRSASDRGKLREKVEREIPCYSHTRQYRGHCNVKTVKDANFFGLQDEYVVSGSDGGHLFIWDKKTSELVNILEGDDEVVNVVQGKKSPNANCQSR